MKHISNNCHQHFARAQAACTCYNSCLQLHYWRQQLLRALAITQGFDIQLQQALKAPSAGFTDSSFTYSSFKGL